MNVKQHKYFDGQVFWYAYRPALPIRRPSRKKQLTMTIGELVDMHERLEMARKLHNI